MVRYKSQMGDGLNKILFTQTWRNINTYLFGVWRWANLRKKKNFPRIKKNKLFSPQSSTQRKPLLICSQRASGHVWETGYPLVDVRTQEVYSDYGSPVTQNLKINIRLPRGKVTGRDGCGSPETLTSVKQLRPTPVLWETGLHKKLREKASLHSRVK